MSRDSSRNPPDLSVGRFNLDYCPNCGGEADNGHSRDVPPVAYFCKACSVPKTVWNCHKCFPKLCRCEDRNEAPNVEVTGEGPQGRSPGEP